MVMTLSAIQPTTHEYSYLLCHVVVGLEFARIVVGCRPSSSLSRYSFQGNLVVRLVLSNAVSNPFPIRKHLLWGKPCCIQSDTEKIGEAKSPIVDVLRRVDQNIDDMLPFGRISTGKKLSNTVWRWKCPGQIKADSPQELTVSRKVGRNNVEFSQLGKGVIVDEVVSTNFGIVGYRICDDSETCA